MGRFASRGHALGGRALFSMLLAFGGPAACGPEQPDAAAQPSAAVVQGVPADKAECRRWTTCVPENPCHTGWVTGCRKNVPICTDIGGWLSNGTSCGTGAVCYMGECEPCAAGQSCPIPDAYGNPDPCRVGAIACGSGQPVCEDQGPAADGTSCMGGGPYVCKGGACTWCVDGSSCTPPGAECHVGVMTACATTGGTCEDTGAVRQNGEWCGGGYPPQSVCRDGDCVACPLWSACTPQEPCWESGYTECSSGWPVCVPNVQKPDGTPCEGGVCQGGQCVAPCFPDQPCTPYNACYSGRTVCDGTYSWCQEVAPLEDGTSCGDGLVCRAGYCTSCGPGTWCPTQDPCHGSGSISCATARCEPAPPPFLDGASCGAGGETCQSGVCTDDADPRLLVRSSYGIVDLTGTTWARCDADWGAGTSTRTSDTYGLGTITHVEETFPTPDCSGASGTRREVGGTVTSAGDRFNVGWTGGAAPPGAPWSVTATAVHLAAVDPVEGPIELDLLVFVNEWSTPHQLYQGDRANLAADGYPATLYPETNPLVEVIPQCVPDQPCTPPYDACYAGRTVCWGTYDGYCERREQLPDGTSCGADHVCSSGACTPCGPASWCQSPDPCYESGALSCATGRCEPQPPPHADGLTCGVGGETCEGGVCTPVPGADPWVRSTSHAVDLAGTTWSNCMRDEPEPGMSRLRVDTYVVGGMTHHEVVFTTALDCSGPTDPARGFAVAATIASGGDRLASWAGGNVPPGAPWLPTATAMHVTAPDSPVGPIDFKELIFVHDAAFPRQLYTGESKDPAEGYPTQLEGSRPMFEVLACDAGSPCAPGFATCETHFIDCSTGAPICAGTGTFLSDGTRCGDGSSWCQAGACVPVPTRTVTGTAWTTYWPDTGAVATTDPALPLSIAALQPPGPVYHPGTLYPDGTFAIPGVEEGPYQLEISTPTSLSYVWTTSSAIDLGVDVLGRQELAWAFAPTPVAFDVDGLTPWALGDVLEFASSNAGVAAFPFGLPNLIAGPEGAIQRLGTVEWRGRPLVDGNLGDVAYVFQGSTTSDPAVGHVTAASGWAALPPDFALADGLGGAVDVTLGPCTEAGAIAADWRRSTFEAYAPLVHPDAAVRNHRIVVSARPHDAAFAPPFRSGNFAQFMGGLPLLVVQSDPGASDVSLAGVGYGRFLPLPWREYRHDRALISVSFTAPGATTSASLSAPLGYDVAAASAPPVVAPVLAPPASLTIAGLDAWGGAAGVGTTPRIAWTAPAVSPETAALFPGASLLYRVGVYEVRLTPTGGTQLALLFEGTTPRPFYRLPGTGLVPGGRYVVRVEASLSADSVDAPLRSARERAYATVVSREFTP